LKLTIGDGRVTLIADNVPVRTILQEWARLGQSKIVNGEKVLGAPVTLRLINVPEDEALDVVLRSASGYLAAPRDVHVANASRFDRIVILATSRPTTTAAAPAPTPPTGAPQPTFPNPNVAPPPVEDDQEPTEDNPNPQGAQVQQPMTATRPGPIQVSPPNSPNGVQPPQNPQQNMPVTSPRPGVIPPPQQPQPQLPPRPIP
jgi:hypothetical protein